ncbi:hypothetical protein MPER_05695, partial [Moniliophthora perniciosa FA553]
MFEDGTGHQFYFHGVAVSLYGTIGPSNSRSYTVQVDDETPQVHSAYRDEWVSRQVLFNADNLGPGSHSVVICNGKCSDLSSRQDDQGLLELDFANVWAVD